MKTFRLISLLGAYLLSFGTTHADPIVRYTFSAHVAGVGDVLPFGMLLEVGSAVTGEIAYDLASTGELLGPTDSYYTQNLVGGMKVVAGGKTIEISSYATFVTNADADGLMFANFAFLFPGNPVQIDGVPGSAFVTVGFLDETGTIFGDTTLPASIDLAEYSPSPTGAVGGFSDPSNPSSLVTLIIDSIALAVVSELPGDVNFDSVVDIFDVNVVSDNWGTAGPTGDANSDGAVDIFDVNVISDNWGATGVAAVPEPSTLAATVLFLLTLLPFSTAVNKVAARN